MPRAGPQAGAVAAIRDARGGVIPTVLASMIMAGVLGVDVLLRLPMPEVAVAVLDELGHAATALLLLAAFGWGASARSRWIVAIAAIAIDADHLPAQFGSRILTHGTARPYTHSLLTVLLVLAVSVLLSPPVKQAGLLVAFGLAAHFLRDLATGPIALLWPLSNEGFRLPYAWYAALLAAAVAAVALRSAMLAGSPSRRQ